MATEKNMKAVILFRRGTEAEWNEVDPVLRPGEPGYAYDKKILKIGDGETPWSELDAPEGRVVDADTHYDFPSIGKENTLYKANKERCIYQWNSEIMAYEVIESYGLDTITLINGGSASL